VTLRATGAQVTLINYGATQTKRGVSVCVKNGRKLLRHAFIATMPNGHKGVFEREGTGHKLVTKKGPFKLRTEARGLFHVPAKRVPTT
jgi:hypothetical protein